jgi:hypothetical protein
MAVLAIVFAFVFSPLGIVFGFSGASRPLVPARAAVGWRRPA